MAADRPLTPGVETGNRIAAVAPITLSMTCQPLAIAAQALSLGFAHQSILTPQLVSQDAVVSAFEALALGAQANTH